jgi:DNA repair exonuclease SbcCD ATPase subunit
MDGKLINQDASTRDYQKHLENNILKLNYRSFTQVVILGSSSFIPFMQLTPAHRREVVEDILDIKIFSMMNVILKQRMKELKGNQGEVKQQLIMLSTKITMASDHIEYTKDKGKVSLTVLEKKIQNNQTEFDKIKQEADELKNKFADWITNVRPKQVKLVKDKNELSNIKWKMEEKSNKAKQEINFFELNDECPTCEQHIDEEFKKKAIEDRTNKMITSACSLTGLGSEISEMNDRTRLYENIQKDARGWEVESAKKRTSAESLLGWSIELTKQITEIRNIDTELAGKKEELKKYKEEIKIVDKEKERLTSDDNYYIIAKQLLQDSGIKTKVIKRYLPIMNKLINGYLNKLEFQVKFDLDEQFNETIKSRYRDEFSYANFSEGEKMRIDLALLFTWRQIAKMKNSTNTNLLILDEIFDSSLDANGTDEFLKILSTLTNENIFLVSHKSDLNIDKFDHLIRFEKVQNFTRMTT